MIHKYAIFLMTAVTFLGKPAYPMAHVRKAFTQCKPVARRMAQPLGNACKFLCTHKKYVALFGASFGATLGSIAGIAYIANPANRRNLFQRGRNLIRRTLLRLPQRLLPRLIRNRLERDRLWREIGEALREAAGPPDPLVNFVGSSLRHVDEAPIQELIDRGDQTHLDPAYLSMAIMFNATQAIRFLLRNGANNNARLDDGQTAIEDANRVKANMARAGEELAYLEDAQPIFDRTFALLAEAARGEFGNVEEQIPHIFVNACEPGTNNCLLHYLVGPYNAEPTEADRLARVLIRDHHAFVNRQNNDGQTPLHRAIQRQNTRLATWLLQNGADPNLRDNNGNTPLHLLAREAHGALDLTHARFAILRNLLIERGAHLDIQNRAQEIPITINQQFFQIPVMAEGEAHA